jgi:hypothetical protein
VNIAKQRIIEQHYHVFLNEILLNNKSVNCYIKNPRKFLVNERNISAYSTLVSSTREPEYVAFVQNPKDWTISRTRMALSTRRPSPGRPRTKVTGTV